LSAVSIDLNADLGESFGIYVIGDDEALMPAITSANIAAGFHGGDPSILRQTIRLAVQHGVAVGAHPSFPDLAGFGRREMQLPDREVEDAVLYQIASVAGVAQAEGASMRHVKPHGALYNMAARDEALAAAVVRAIVAFNPALTLFAPPDSALAKAGAAAGLRVAREGFADRAYDGSGRLVSRSVPGAVFDDDDAVASQAVQIAVRGEVVSLEGSRVPMRADTICVHGDAPGAARRAARVRSALEAAGVVVAAP
jgi:5-oxoprolinase (ATP-hydrolysing) subunit A